MTENPAHRRPSCWSARPSRSAPTCAPRTPAGARRLDPAQLPGRRRHGRRGGTGQPAGHHPGRLRRARAEQRQHPDLHLPARCRRRAADPGAGQRPTLGRGLPAHGAGQPGAGRRQPAAAAERHRLGAELGAQPADAVLEHPASWPSSRPCRPRASPAATSRPSSTWSAARTPPPPAGWTGRCSQLGPGTTFRAVIRGLGAAGVDDRRPGQAGDELAEELQLSRLGRGRAAERGGDPDHVPRAGRPAGRGRADHPGRAGHRRRPRRPRPARRTARSTRPATSPPRWPISPPCCAPRSACRSPPSTSAAGTPTPTRPTSSTATSPRRPSRWPPSSPTSGRCGASG